MSRHSQAFMDSVLGVMRFLQVGVSSNWFGLSCPSHCGAATFSTILASYLLGLLSGFALGLVGLLYFFGFPRPTLLSPPGSARGPLPSLTRLQRYLHEHQS